jgi:hypothetical protein
MPHNSAASKQRNRLARWRSRPSIYLAIGTSGCIPIPGLKSLQKTGQIVCYQTQIDHLLQGGENSLAATPPDGRRSAPTRFPPEGTAMDELYLRSGVFLAPFHNHDENPTLSIERDLELLEHLDRLNYHEAWIGEHHSGGFELIACPEMFIAAAAQRTRHIRLGTGVVSLPYHNPFMVADRMVQLDHMTRGRSMFGAAEAPPAAYQEDEDDRDGMLR